MIESRVLRGDRTPPPWWFQRPLPLAAAAALVVVAAVSAGIFLGRSRPPFDPAVPAGGGIAGPDRAAGRGEEAGPPGAVDRQGRSAPISMDAPEVHPRLAPAMLAPPDLDSTEADFNLAAERLLAALEAQRDRIPPETMALIEENLRAINAAIDETRRAMESDPGNAGLGRLMRAMYHSKMRLLQGAAATPSS